MAIVEQGTLIQVRIALGPNGLVTCTAQDPASLGEDVVDPIQVADPGPITSGGPFLLTQNAANVGEARVFQNTASAFASIALGASDGLGNRVPVDQTTKTGIFWGVDADNTMHEASNPDRAADIFVGFAARPESYKLLLTDSVGCDIAVDLYFRPYNTSGFPALADIAFSANSDTTQGPIGNQRVVTIDTSALGTAFPAQMRARFTNRGDNTPVSIASQWAEFPPQEP
jgi:hypothetical protein